jgi:hypothetical protein
MLRLKYVDADGHSREAELPDEDWGVNAGFALFLFDGITTLGVHCVESLADCQKGKKG